MLPDGRVRRFATDRTALAVAAVVVAALAVRLVALGARPFHWDEARVGYWTLRYLATGEFTYRPVAGGPLVYHLTAPAVATFGASDWAARLPVALVGGCLPAAALLFRGRLRDDETVWFALLLAVDPLFVYYSRFLRGDVLLAAFALVAVGCGVRAHDAGRAGYVYAAAVATALAVASSGFALGYLACLSAAALFVVDHRALVGGDALVTRLAAVAARLRRDSTTLARAVPLFVGVTVFLYAPRAGRAGDVGLWNPATFPAAVESALVGSASKFVGVRVLDRYPEATHAFFPAVADFGAALVAGALVVAFLGAGAVLRDRYTGGVRPLLAFFGFWALVGLFVFPVAAEVVGPWVALHVALPLSLPAAVGVAAVVRFGRAAGRAGDAVTASVCLLVVVAAGVQVGGVLAGDVYADSPGDSRLAQYGQPADDLRPFARDVAAAASSGGTTVAYVGDRFALAGDPSVADPPVPDAWGERLPLAWYVARAGASTTSVRTPSEFTALSPRPPVVVADPADATYLRDELDGYASRTYRLAKWNRKVVVFVRT